MPCAVQELLPRSQLLRSLWQRFDGTREEERLHSAGNVGNQEHLQHQHSSSLERLRLIEDQQEVIMQHQHSSLLLLACSLQF